jgi:cbb3-type cytochrome oxidase subunit 3
MHEVIKSIAGQIGLVTFFVVFIGVIFWIYRPGSKKLYDQASLIPLSENNHD